MGLVLEDMADTESRGWRRAYCKEQRGSSVGGGMEVTMKRDVITLGGHSLCDEYVFSYRGEVKLFSNFFLCLCITHISTSLSYIHL